MRSKTDGQTGEEFVELYNTGNEPAALLGLQLKYKSATGAIWTKKADLTGNLPAKSFQVVTLTGLNNTEGHVCLAAANNNCSQESQSLDKVGWGPTANSPEGTSAASPVKGSSIQRCFQGQVLVDTNNNATDLIDYGAISAGQGMDCLPPPNEEPPVPGLSCEGAIITEILPNATGTDSGNEFIELHNPTADYIDLVGCGLQLAGEEFIYRFGGITLLPGEYRTFFDTETNITLPNSSGGTVYLLSAADEELQAVLYAPDLADDVAWAWFGGTDWQQTFTATPNATNISQPTEPCPTGQVREPETDRCMSQDDGNTSGLKPCNPGQERNPATNRCRAVLSASAASGLAPCKPGQERNPETNRCRSVTSTASTLKPCAPGQERNPQTNRCRKVAGATTSGGNGSVKDVEAATSSTSPGWWVAGIAATGAIGYGMWEWRRDIGTYISRFSRKIAGQAAR